LKIKLWGTRGSLASPGSATVRYGGNTSCVSVQGSQGTILVLDAGTGIRGLGQHLPEDIQKVHIFLTHLHMDHVQGLPFFAPLRRAGVEIHIYGPTSTTLQLSSRLTRYLSPPLFPVSIRELNANLHFHELPGEIIEIAEFKIDAQLVIHPNPTIGYRIWENDKTITYLPDHEPALGVRRFPPPRAWLSGFRISEGADLLIHDSQYSADEYRDRIGFGHSSMQQAIQFGALANIKQLVPFHHDPAHSDDDIDKITKSAIAEIPPPFKLIPGLEGSEIEL
jgi:phosphoribosyl 1,2-cyclic phosphodiesterase